MNIIKKFDKISDLNEYASYHPEIIQRWGKSGALVWRRILVVKTESDAAVLFSATLPIRIYARIYALIRHLFPALGNYYARKLGAKKVEFLHPSQLSPPSRKVSHAAKSLIQHQTLPPVAKPAQKPPANPDHLQRAHRAMERAETMLKDEKLQILDWISRKLAENRNQYHLNDLQNILKTVRAARQLIADSDWWEAYAVRVQNSRKVPQTDSLTAVQVKGTIYDRLGIIAHPEINHVAPVLRSFGTIFVSGLLAARELGQEAEFLKYAVSGEDICLEGRAKSASAWIENNVLTSIAIDVDPSNHDYMQASYGYVAAFKETQFRHFYRDAYKREYEGGMLAGYGEKMIFNSDTWKAYKFILEADPRFYQHYCTPEKFAAFVRNEAPHGLNLVKERGKKYANLNADNILAALEDAKPVTEADHFNMSMAHAGLTSAKERAIRRLDRWTSFNPSERVAIDVARQKGFAVQPRPPKTGAYLLMLFDVRRHAIQQLAFDVLPGGAIQLQKPHSILKKYFPTIEDFFKGLKLQWSEVI
ncbi:MAG: hypothetical protein LLG04_14120 [Parachlamydia sp.]|nr:hypothetical protein [Parachlamydia sp.]